MSEGSPKGACDSRGRVMESRKPLQTQPPAASPYRIPLHRGPVLARRTHPGARLTLTVGRLLQTPSATERKKPTRPPNTPATSEGINAIFQSRLLTHGLHTTPEEKDPHFIQLPRLRGRDAKSSVASDNSTQDRTEGTNNRAHYFQDCPFGVRKVSFHPVLNPHPSPLRSATVVVRRPARTRGIQGEGKVRHSPKKTSRTPPDFPNPIFGASAIPKTIWGNGHIARDEKPAPCHNFAVSIARSEEASI